MQISKRALAALAALLALIVAAMLLIIGPPDDQAERPAPTLTIPGQPGVIVHQGDGVEAVDGPDKDTKRDDAVPLAPTAADELQDAVTATDQAGDTHRELSEPLREADDGPVVLNEGPLAAQELDGCRTRFVRNSSSRAGVKPRVIVWHQTVSRDRAGRADQDGLTAMANRASSGVSWHLLIGGVDGLCTYTVPMNLKAWTQGNANPFSIGIEVQAFGDEPSYVRAAGRSSLLARTRSVGKRYGIPMRRGLVRNCRVVKSGVVMHRDLGACGGGHVDVASTRWQRNPSGGELAGWTIGPLIADLAGGGVTGTDRATCRKLNSWRKAGSPKGGDWERNSVNRRRALAKRSVLCTTRGPVKH